MANPAATGRSSRRWLIAIAVMSSAVMEVLDTSVVNVSLPHIAGSLSSTVDEATWVLTSYIVANAIILPITGWLSNYFGRKRLLLTVVTGFTVSSVLCGLAPSLPLLVFFRVMQGITGGGLQPLSQSVLLEEFPLEERGKAMALWGMGIIAAPVLGPTLGGWITDNYSWRWVFYINLPIGIISLMLISPFVVDPPYLKRGTMRVDGWGLGMLAIGMGALQIMFDKGQEEDWFGSHFITMLADHRSRHADGIRHPRVARCAAAGEVVAIQIPVIHRRDRGGHGARVCALWQPGAAAPVHAGAAGVERRHGRHLDQPARNRHRRLHAAGWLPSGQEMGCPLDAGVRNGGSQHGLLWLFDHESGIPAPGTFSGIRSTRG